MKKSSYTWHGVPVVAMITGSIAGGFEAAATWPNEVIKTELQTQTDNKYKGVIDCGRQKVRTQGIMSLYRGLVPIVLGSMPKAGIRFGGYTLAANYLQDENKKMGSLESVMAGVVAGSLEAVLAVTPLETLKTRLINNNLPFVSGTADILRKEGLGGIYKGVVPTIAKQSLNQASRFFVYNNYAAFMKTRLGTKDLDTQWAVFGGMIAGTASSFVNQPVDTIKTRMQGVGAGRYKSTIDCVVQTVKNEGPLALYKGLIPRLGRVVPGQGIIFGVYNFVSPKVEKLFVD
eukprot:INCI9833.1.p1 GENE.INCI9833.1~~INCI9833.1.p1  ORF type:complete len:288 (-),score=46.92 INCI9833.1:122-985(-)